MEIKIDKEFEKLIPKLTDDKKIILNRKKINYNDYPESITITPFGKDYCNVSRINPRNEMVEEYTKRPININYINVFLKDIKLDDYNIEIKENIIIKKEDNTITTNVYIIQSIIGGPIKIGKSNNIDERFKQIQNMSPFKLRIIKVFENVLDNFEIYLHNKYAQERLHGEWFDEIILGDILNEKENKWFKRTPIKY